MARWVAASTTAGVVVPGVVVGAARGTVGVAVIWVSARGRGERDRDGGTAEEEAGGAPARAQHQVISWGIVP
jgi:hypothetical protein